MNKQRDVLINTQTICKQLVADGKKDHAAMLVQTFCNAYDIDTKDHIKTVNKFLDLDEYNIASVGYHDQTSLRLLGVI